jgi:hypothetical protein
MHKPFNTMLGLALLAIASALHAQQPTAADAAAEREFALARPELFHLNKLIDSELQRALSNPGEKSPEIAQLMRDDDKQMSLGDASVPLHLRLIERRRRTVIAMYLWTKSMGHCDNPEFSAASLVDPAFRKTMESANACREAALTRMETGLHDINKAEEASILELKVPSWIQTKMLAEARTKILNDDAALIPVVRNRRATLKAMNDLIQFMEAHAAQVHFSSNQLVLANDADAKTAQDLMQKVLELGAAE